MNNWEIEYLEMDKSKLEKPIYWKPWKTPKRYKQIGWHWKPLGVPDSYKSFPSWRQVIYLICVVLGLVGWLLWETFKANLYRWL